MFKSVNEKVIHAQMAIKQTHFAFEDVGSLRCRFIEVDVFSNT